MKLIKPIKLLMLLTLSMLLCSCSYDANNRIMSGMDSFAERVGIKKQDPGKRLASIHRGVYDFYKNYELVYFYSDKDPNSKTFEKTIRQYARDSWVKTTFCSVDKKQLPYTIEDVSGPRDIRYAYFVDRYARGQIKVPTLFLLLEANGEIDVYPISTREKCMCTLRFSRNEEICNFSISPTGVIPYEKLVERINKIASWMWSTLQKGDTSHV